MVFSCMKKRNKKNKSKYMIIIAIFLLILSLGIASFLYHKHIEDVEKNKLHIKLKDDLTAEIKSDVILSQFIDSIDNGEMLNGNETVDTKKLGKFSQKLILNNKYDEKEEYEFMVTILVYY